MFGREKETPAVTLDKEPVAPSIAAKAGGKGRPTPRRREQEAQNRRPLVVDDRKAASKANREATREQRMKIRQAMLNGEERYLPVRDKGPVRRWTRDVIDSRRNIGEYFLIAAVVIVLLGVVPNPNVRVISQIALYVLVLVCIGDALLLRRSLKRRLTAKFGESRSKGAPLYGVLRAFQLRRSRMPRVMVKRGETPRD